jgi:hypothetical protein
MCAVCSVWECRGIRWAVARKRRRIMKPKRPNCPEPAKRELPADVKVEALCTIDELYEANKWYIGEKRKAEGWKVVREVEQYTDTTERIDALLRAYRAAMKEKAK